MIEDLNRFILVANSGNLTKTARNIFITQSALSQSMNRLERTIGSKLFRQKGKYLELTPNGEHILPLATKIIELWEKTKNPTLIKQLKITYSLGAYDNAALRLGNFFKANLQSDLFNLELTIDRSNKIMKLLEIGLLDLAICVIDTRNTQSSSTVLIKKLSEALIPVAAKKQIALPHKEPFIMYNKDSNTRVQMDSIFLENRIKPNIFAESSSVTFIKELAILNCGVAFLPLNVVKHELKSGLLKRYPFPFSIKRHYGIYINKNGLIEKDSYLTKSIIKSLNTI